MFQSNPPPVSRWYVTHHLRQRAAERGISEAEVFAVIERPEVVYDQPDYGSRRQVRQRGPLGVVVDYGTGAIITVVFRDPQQWVNHLAVCAA